MAQLRYAGRLADLYPQDIEQALAVDVVLDTVQDIVQKTPNDHDQKKKKMMRQA